MLQVKTKDKTILKEESISTDNSFSNTLFTLAAIAGGCFAIFKLTEEEEVFTTSNPDPIPEQKAIDTIPTTAWKMKPCPNSITFHYIYDTYNERVWDKNPTPYKSLRDLWKGWPEYLDLVDRLQVINTLMLIDEQKKFRQIHTVWMPHKLYELVKKHTEELDKTYSIFESRASKAYIEEHINEWANTIYIAHEDENNYCIEEDRKILIDTYVDDRINAGVTLGYMYKIHPFYLSADVEHYLNQLEAYEAAIIICEINASSKDKELQHISMSPRQYKLMQKHAKDEVDKLPIYISTRTKPLNTINYYIYKAIAAKYDHSLYIDDCFDHRPQPENIDHKGMTRLVNELTKLGFAKEDLQRVNVLPSSTKLQKLYSQCIEEFRNNDHARYQQVYIPYVYSGTKASLGATGMGSSRIYTSS